MIEINRCGWCNNDKLYQAYHDSEWGVPCRDDKKLFEFLILEGAQAGLSWITILKRREQYRQAFCGFQVDRVAEFTTEDVARLMGNKGIIRNRLKIESAISNARVIKKFSLNTAVSANIFGHLWVIHQLLIIGYLKKKFPRQQRYQTGLVEK